MVKEGRLRVVSAGSKVGDAVGEESRDEDCSPEAEVNSVAGECDILWCMLSFVERISLVLSLLTGLFLVMSSRAQLLMFQATRPQYRKLDSRQMRHESSCLRLLYMAIDRKAT